MSAHSTSVTAHMHNERALRPHFLDARVRHSIAEQFARSHVRFDSVMPSNGRLWVIWTTPDGMALRNRIA